MDSIYKIKGVVQHYSWGGTQFIPQLLGVANDRDQPFGEYWLGAHPKSPAIIEKDGTPLDQLIQQHPAETLGDVRHQFDTLPFLFKILDVRQMLSIQVHPSKEVAEEGYEKENARGIPLSAPHRNYKDENHKPELMVALSEFWLLHGFKKEEDLLTVLHCVPELNEFIPIFEKSSYKGLYEEVMTMSQNKVDKILSPLLQRILPLYESKQLAKSEEDFWAARAALTFCPAAPYDRGIFSIYFFNVLNLKEGEAIYQAAGLPHAYLEGQNVEVMANSDNVLRAGLTDKHVDVPELLKHVKFEATHPNIIPASTEAEQSFPAPVEEFLLKKHVVGDPVSLSVNTATIFFVYEGKGKAVADGTGVDLQKGEAALVMARQQVSLEPSSSSMVCFSVSTPLDKN